MVTQSESSSSSGCCVESVNGKTGVVVLTTSDVAEGTNEYFTDARAREAIDATTPILYNDVTGIITHATSGVAAGTYGNASTIPVITVNASGHITSITGVGVSGGGSIGPDLTAIEALTGTGYLVRTAVNTWALRSIQGVSGRINITNADSVSAPTVVDLASIVTLTPGVYGGPASYPVITVDAYGRITYAETQSIATPPLPPHTHTLGNLSNVKDNVDSAAQLGQAVIWDGTEFVATFPKVKFDDYEVTPAVNWQVATGDGDVHTPTLDEPINLVRVETGINNKKVVSIHAVLYGLASVMQVGAISRNHPTYASLTRSFYIPKRIGTIPIEARPIHNLDIPLVSYLQGEAYWNADHTEQFAGDQAFVSLNLHINTDGELWLSAVLLGDLISELSVMGETGSDLAYVIAPIVVSYPTDTIIT